MDLAMKSGSQLTLRQARTGLFTPPGMRVWAFSKSSWDLVWGFLQMLG